MVPKPKAQLSKLSQNVYSIASQKFELFFYQKYEKWKPNEKLSINCNHIGEGSYMFISTSVIGHLTSY